jgi:hypothetical protein
MNYYSVYDRLLFPHLSFNNRIAFRNFHFSKIFIYICLRTVIFQEGSLSFEKLFLKHVAESLPE